MRYRGLFCLMILLGLPAWGKEYAVSPDGTVSVSVSNQGVNRLMVAGDRIASVVGNQDAFLVESDADLGQLFLTPQLKVGEKTHVSLMTEQGREIDVAVVVQSEPPQTLVLKPFERASLMRDVGSGMHARAFSHEDRQKQILSVLKKMVAGGGTKHSGLSCLKNHPTLKLESVVSFGSPVSGSPLVGLKARIRNKSDAPLVLEEEDFARCMDHGVAVSLEQKVLQKNQAITLYMVGK